MNSRRLARTFCLAVLALGLVVFAGGPAAARQNPPRTAPIAIPGNPERVDHPPGARRATIALVTSARERGPLDLVFHDGVYVGSFAIENIGDEPLVVSRVAVRGDDEDVRAPSGVSVRLADSPGGGGATSVPPGGDRRVVVTWAPERNARMRQVFGHVIVTSNDEAAGEVAMGIHAEQIAPLPYLAFLSTHLLSWLTFSPLAGALAIVLLQALGRGSDRSARAIALAVTGMQCLLAVWVASLFRGDVVRLDGNDGFQFVERAVWVRSFHVEYAVGIDGVSAPMVLLTALVSFLGCIASASIGTFQRGYYALYLLLVTGMMGTFVALDLFLFYVFWEVMLLPMYFLIGVWGGPRREYAAIKFFLYTLVGSVLMLLAFLALYLASDRTFLVDGTVAAHTFSIPELSRVSFAGKNLTIFGLAFVKVVWVMLFLAFAIKIPTFPLHTWLPDAHVEAPTPVSVVLAAILLKTGAYGVLRILFTILPEATRWAAGAIVVLGVVNVLYGALCAMAQDDLKRLVAYSSVSHMGFCLIGLGALTPQGIAACLIQMVSHGVVTAMLFLLVGVLSDRVHTRSLSAFGGLAGEMPLYATLAGLAFMASLGLPGLSGFWGEVLALLGAFPSYRTLTAVAAIGLVLSAAYHLGALQRIFLGPFRASWRASPALDPFGGRFPDLTGRELASIAPLAALTILLGFWPVPLFALIAGGVRDLTSYVDPPGPDQIASLVHRAGRALAALP